MARTSGGFMGTSCLLENLVTAARIGIFSPCEVLSGTGTSAQTSSHLLSLSLEGLVVRDPKLQGFTAASCASQEAWYLASIISFLLGSYLYFVFFLHRLLVIDNIPL